MAPETLRIGTRGSALALRQAELVVAALCALPEHPRVEIRIIETKGDRILDRALSRIGDKGLFVTEIESSLLAGQIDLAVHSCKDLPFEETPGLTLAAFPVRADARDALISPHGLDLAALPLGARIGTSSLRRAAQLRAYRPDFEVLDLRGNVDTRLRKALSGDYDAIVLAAAGLQRLGLAERVTQLLAPEIMLPAVAQGALALQCRSDDTRVLPLLVALDDGPTRIAVEAERAFLGRLQGGCQVPLAAYAQVQAAKAGPIVSLRGLVATVDGVQIVRGERKGPAAAATAIGRELAEDLLRNGADVILERLSRVVLAVAIPDAGASVVRWKDARSN